MLGISAPCCGACVGLTALFSFRNAISITIHRTIYGTLDLHSKSSMKAFAERSVTEKISLLAKIVLTRTALGVTLALAFRSILIFVGYTPWSMLAFALIFGGIDVLGSVNIYNHIDNLGEIAAERTPASEGFAFKKA